MRPKEDPFAPKEKSKYLEKQNLVCQRVLTIVLLIDEWRNQGWEQVLLHKATKQ